MSSPVQGCTLSSEAQSLIDMAHETAVSHKVSVNSNHLLLAIFNADNIAQDYLLEHNIDPRNLSDVVDASAKEPAQVLEMVWKTACSMGPEAPGAVLTSLHLLAGLLRYHRRSAAVSTLRKAGYDTNRLRNTLISHLTHRRQPPRHLTSSGSWDQIEPVQVESGHDARLARSAGAQPQHGGQGYGAPPKSNPNLDPAHPLSSPNPYLPRPTQHQRPMPPRPAPLQPRPAPPIRPRQSGPPSSPSHRARPRKGSPGARRGPPPRKNLSSRMKGRFGSRKPSRDREDIPKPSLKNLADGIFSEDIPLDEMRQQVADDIKRLGPELGDSGSARPRMDEPPKEAKEKAKGRSPGAAKPTKARSKRANAPTVRRPVRPERRDPDTQRQIEARYTLDEEVFPFSSKLGRNLSMLAVQGDIDALVGRDAQIHQLTDILNKRRSNNPLLVGPPGVGKTAIVEGLALEMVRRDQDEDGGNGRVLIELEMGRLLSGTQLRGSFSERLIGLKDEVAQAEGRVIIFLDEIHTWIGAGASGDGGADAAGELKAALARGRFPCIGATTNDEFNRFIETDPAFRRRFQVVEVDEPSEEECLAILAGVLPAYSEHHGVEFDPEAVQAAVRLSKRYIPEQRLPDKAIGLLDLAGSRARRKTGGKVDRVVVAEVVSERTGVPIDKLLMRDKDRFLRMEEILSASLIGHRPVIQRICEVIRRNYAGFHSDQPIGSFLFLGPTGVGKTETVKVLADFLFRDRAAIVRLDMSEYRESHAVSRLIGAPPGYVGHEAGGQLTEAVRRKPYQIVLLDEVEKAHPEVLNILLQLLDDGRLTDGKGRTVDFTNTVVIMTSNLGSQYLSQGLKAVTAPRIGFGIGAAAAVAATNEIHLTEEVVENVIGVARTALTLELWNRIEDKLVFGPLSRDEVARIARLQFQASARRLAAEREIYLEADDNVYAYLIDHGGYDPQLGARPMRQTLQRLVEASVAEMILRGAANPGDHVLVHVKDGELHFDIADV